MASTIKISQPTTLPNDQIRSAVDQVFAELSQKYTLTGKWKNDKDFIISGEGIIGRLEIFEESVEVMVTLGGILGAFSKMIESQIQENLRNHLAP
jgi:putative polyhydroxyalkanoate system protein